MTAKLDTMVSAAAPVLRPVSHGPANTQGPTEAQRLAGVEAERTKSEAHKALTARWDRIAAAGGVDAWVLAELRAKGLYTEAPSAEGLSDKDRAAYKARKKAEAVERRRCASSRGRRTARRTSSTWGRRFTGMSGRAPMRSTVPTAPRCWPRAASRP
jgi:hypothetical protein